LRQKHFPSLLRHKGATGNPAAQPSLAAALDNLEREMIVQALEQTGGNKTQAAKKLGLHSSALYRRLEKYHLLGMADDKAATGSDHE